MHGHLEIVKYLHSKIKMGLNMNGGYVAYSMIYAASNGFIDVIKYLQTCDKSIDYNAKNLYGETLLTSATFGHQLETVKYLLTLPQININQTGQDGNTALSTAAISGDIEIAKVLTKVNGIDINHNNAYNATPLKLAILHKNIEVSEFLKSIGCKEE